MKLHRVGPVRMVAANIVRRRWRGALVVMLLVGLSGATVLAVVAGARRSASSLGRFYAYSRPSDLEIQIGATTPYAQIQEFAHEPGVAAVGALVVYDISIDGLPNLKTGAAINDNLGSILERARLVKGRRPGSDAPDEIDIGEGLAAQKRVHIGDVLTSRSVTPAQMSMIFQGHDPGAPAGPELRLHVVGIVRRPLDLGDLSATGGVVVFTPAFNRAYESRMGRYAEVLRVRTKRGAADIPTVSQEARARFGAEQVFNVRDVTGESQGASQAIDVVTLALVIFAVITALASVVTIAIVVSREMSQTTTDQSTFRSLGLTYWQRFGAMLPQPLLIAAGGATLAVLGAIVLSPILPVGIARRADVDVGFHADWFVLGIGAAAILAFVAIAAALSVARAARVDAAERAASSSLASIAAAAMRSGARPTLGNGVRMALQGRADGGTVPARSAFAGAAFGVLGISALLVLSSSLAHLASTPRLYGWTFAFNAPDNNFDANNSCVDDQHSALGINRIPGVTDLAGVCTQSVQVEKRLVNGFGFTPLRGSLQLEITAGRAPAASDEIALGAKTLAALHKHIGDSIAASSGGHSGSYHIVGTVVLPRIAFPDVQPLADGAVFTGDGMKRIENPANENHWVVGRERASASPNTILARVDESPSVHVAGPDSFYVTTPYAFGPTVPPEIERLRQLNWFAPVLAALLAALSIVAVAHTIVTGTRRRRRELALLKTLGFQRRQVRATIGWQVTTIMAVGVAFGVPLGVVVGRVSWRVINNSLGIAAAPVMPAIALLILVGAGILIVNVVAVLPARSAARLRPAIALRSE